MILSLRQVATSSLRTQTLYNPSVLSMILSWAMSPIHGWEHKISKSRQTQATGGKNCEKAGKLPRLCGDIIQ